MIEQIIKLLNSMSVINIIPVYSEKKPPKKPYATYCVISKKTKDFFGYSERKYNSSDNSNIEKRRYRETAVIQFDVYEDSISGEFIKTQKLLELIIFILRKEWRNIDVGIVEFSEIKNLREEIQNKYERRASFDVTFEYMNLTEERKIEIAEVIELIANKEKIIIEEEQNGL